MSRTVFLLISNFIPWIYQDELARTVAENVKLLGQLDTEKASHLERKELLLRRDDELEKVVQEKSKVSAVLAVLF